MSVVSEIERIKTNISNAYTELEGKGATIPTEKNSANLPTTIASIQSGGGEAIEITDAYRLFYEGVRLDSIEGLCKAISSKCTNFKEMFRNSYGKITEIPVFNSSGGQDFSYMCTDCGGLTSFPAIDTSNGTNFSSMLSGDANVNTLPLLDFGNATNINGAFNSCGFNDSVGGFKDLGKAYLTTSAANYVNYTLNLTSAKFMKYESIMNIINNLYDIASMGCQPQTLRLYSTRLNLLSESDIAIATNKGWNITT